MPLSRFRLNLAAWFALAFVAGLTLLNLTLYAYLGHQSDQRLTRHLQEGAVELAEAIRLEYREAPDSGLVRAAREAFAEWPRRSEALVVYANDGARLAEWGDAAELRRMPTRLGPSDTSVTDVPSGGEYPLRQVTVSAGPTPRFLVRASGTTRPISEESEALALWLGLSLPIVLALSLVGGYLLSRRALKPIHRLERAVAAIAPNELDRRLPAGRGTDEIDHLAGQFNGLLERLQRSQSQNYRFVQHAAHQIRTPLTLVLGEADLGLDRPRSPLEQHQALERIRSAATQMKHRVDELLLLARAEAGERLSLDTVVELDGLVLECADLMRARAQALGQQLELLQVEPVSARGNEALLKEAVLELLENACRYGAADRPIAISAFPVDGSARVQVTSFGGAPPPRLAPNGSGPNLVAPESKPLGLGLAIVRWIASEHHGSLTYEREAGFNVYALLLPALPQTLG